MKELTNVEIALLQLIWHENKISGYEINRFIIERGYREWAGIGATSIYVGLKKLEKKKFVESFVDINKTGKGPLPKKYKINKAGFENLKDEVKKILCHCRKNDRFDLAICSMPILKNKEVIFCLNKRKDFFNEIIKNVESKFLSQGGENLPLNVKVLFKHSLSTLSENIKFVDYLIKEINK